MALLPGCPPPVPTPAPHRRSVRTLAKKYSQLPLASVSGEDPRICSREKNIGLAERDILVLEACIKCLGSPPYMAPRLLPIALITNAGFTPLSPQPCQASHGYRVTNAHHEEVRVSADLHSSLGLPPVGSANSDYCCILYNCKEGSEIHMQREEKGQRSMQKSGQGSRRSGNLLQGNIRVSRIYIFRFHLLDDFQCFLF
jgi:hypothetical protein